MKKTIFIVLFSIAALAFTSCGGGSKDYKIDGTKGRVIEVIDGNTIKLHSGLVVNIYGIKDTEHSREYLEKYVKGKNVTLRVDSKAYRKTYRNSSTTVSAYVKLADRPGSIAGDMLRGDFAELEIGTMKDSVDNYASYTQKKRSRLLTSSELLTRIKPATFLIMVKMNDGSAHTGTGFFISDRGLALTNNHVLNYDAAQAQIAFLGENGQIDESNVYPIYRILHSVGGQKIDYTIFEVQMNGAKTDYIPLASKHPNDGDQVAKLGCPVGLVGNFQTGVLSNYFDGYFSHSISSNHGDSGGPVVNFYGEAVGVNQSIEFNQSLSQMSGSLQKAEGVAYAVDIDVIKQWLEENDIPYGR